MIRNLKVPETAEKAIIGGAVTRPVNVLQKIHYAAPIIIIVIVVVIYTAV